MSVFYNSALEVSGPEANAKFPWSKIDAVRVVGATGSLGDDPMVPVEKRIGLAIFLKDGKESRTEGGQADAILAAGTRESARQCPVGMRRPDVFRRKQSRDAGPTARGQTGWCVP